jgi:hypothetical protein
MRALSNEPFFFAYLNGNWAKNIDMDQTVQLIWQASGT